MSGRGLGGEGHRQKCFAGRDFSFALRFSFSSSNARPAAAIFLLTGRRSPRRFGAAAARRAAALVGGDFPDSEPGLAIRPIAFLPRAGMPETRHEKTAQTRKPQVGYRDVAATSPCGRPESPRKPVLRCRRLCDAEASKEEAVVKFSQDAAQPYDDRIFRFVADNMIWTLAGRTKILFLCGERQRSYKAALKGIPIVAVDPRNTSRTGMCIDPQRRSENSTDVLRCRLRLIRPLLTLLVPGISGHLGSNC